MDAEQIKEILRQSLTIVVRTESVYTGGLGGDALYKDTHTIILMLDGEPISEAWL